MATPGSISKKKMLFKYNYNLKKKKEEGARKNRRELQSPEANNLGVAAIKKSTWLFPPRPPVRPVPL